MSDARPSVPRSFGHRFLRLYTAGLLGVLTLPLVIVPLLQARPLPPGLPSLPVLAALSLLQPALLLALGVALGLALAPRLGLRSLLADAADLRSAGRALWPLRRLALGSGLACAALVVGADALVFRRLLPEFFARAAQVAPDGGSALLVGLFYGGITEELMMRWGLMAGIAWLLCKLLRQPAAPGHGLMHAAIALSALAFGAGHLPAAAAVMPLEPVGVLRILLLNALPALLFGWLFWRHCLEAAMLAHAAAHLGFFLLQPAGL